MAVADGKILHTFDADAHNRTNVRLWLGLIATLALAAFLLGMRNRLTAGGLFLFPPAVDLIPPLTAQAWWDAYMLHQQDPAFAACGATETLDDFHIIYLREWLWRASILLLAGTAALGTGAAIIQSRLRPLLPRMGAFAALGFAYAAAAIALGLAIPRVPALARFDVGQYRHAIDLAFASAAVAGLLAAALAEPGGARRAPARGLEWAWSGAILLVIATGAVFAVREAGGVWSTWPGYEGQALPPLERLTSYSPFWLNFTANPYMIQLCHRVLAAALLAAALAWLGVEIRRRTNVWPALALVLLIGGEMAAGVATLVSDAPVAPSILHQVGGIVLLAGALLAMRLGRAARA
jgi:cytochrome c oxidase assembly protein subunit 15